MNLTFLGATESVTGSKHLITTSQNHKVLLDCGLFQGTGKETDGLNRHLGFNPTEIDAVVLSHAHIDHSGNLPYLVQQGFKGKIYCTPGTYELCKILLPDSAHIHENDIIYINKRRRKLGMEELKPLYTIADAEKCLLQFELVSYQKPEKITPDLELLFTQAGHILGSSVCNLTLERNHGKPLTLTYTGDIGRYDDLLMKNPEPFPQAQYIICESTYGNSLHPQRKDASKQLLQCVEKTCIEKRGRLLIPAFSLGRTQEIVYTLNNLFNENKLPKVKIFVDSPLSVSATKVMFEHRYCLNDNVVELMEKDPDPFGFEGLNYIQDIQDSKKLNVFSEPCIIISASGMMDAGRIKHHLKHALPFEKNTVLIAGYCTPESLGGKLLRGDKEVRIFGEPVRVNAEIQPLSSFSAHADYGELLKFLSCQDKKKIKKLFLVHGEKEVKQAFKTTLEEQGYNHVIIPHTKESIKLD